MYEYRYNIIYYNIIPVLVITSWIFGWFTIHLFFTFYVFDLSQACVAELSPDSSSRSWSLGIAILASATVRARKP